MSGSTESPLKRLASLIRRRPAAVALAGLLIVVLTPFAFFPEIMGDAGVKDPGALRNVMAVVFLLGGMVLLVLGLVTGAWRWATRRNEDAGRKSRAAQ